MRKMSAMGKVKAQKCVSWLQTCCKNRSICLRSTMGLHVGIFGTKKCLCSIYGQLFHLIYHFTSSIISLSRISFSIFIGQNRAGGLHNLITHKILGSNQLQTINLTLFFVFYQFKNLFVASHNMYKS